MSVKLCIGSSKNEDKSLEHDVFIPEEELQLDKINCAEKSLALCHFQKALDQANEILECEHVTQVDASDGRYSSRNLNESILLKDAYDVRLSNLLSSINHPPQDDDVMSTFSIVIQSPGNQKYLVLERASSVAIQSSYELWKTRNCDGIDDEIRTNLSTFLKTYGRSKSTSLDNKEFISDDSINKPLIMTLELATLYIHFCHAIGLYRPASISSLEVISALMDIEQKQSDRIVQAYHNVDEILYESYVDLLDLILVQTLPRIQDIRIIESVLDDLQLLLRGKNSGNQMKLNDKSFLLWNHARKSSIEVVRKNLDAFIASEGKNLSKHIREAIYDTFLDLSELSTQVLDDDKSDACDSNVKSILEDATARLMEKDRNEITCSVNENVEKKVKKFDGLVHYFWESEDRWMNRGKALAVGFLTYSAFKRKRRISSSVKAVSAVILSPVREIVRAIVPPK